MLTADAGTTTRLLPATATTFAAIGIVAVIAGNPSCCREEAVALAAAIGVASGLVFYGAARFPNADTYLTEFYDSAAAIGAPGAMSNFSHCSVADDAIRQARMEPDAQKQLALWKDAQVKIHGDVCAVPLFGLKQVWARGDRVNYGYALKGALNLQPPITELTTVSAP